MARRKDAGVDYFASPTIYPEDLLSEGSVLGGLLRELFIREPQSVLRQKKKEKKEAKEQ
ncbi:MAG: hypothetical protein AAB691_01490 [Patescibacteria group bacterium]